MPLAVAIALSWGNVSAQEIRTLEDYLEQCLTESEDEQNPEYELRRENAIAY